MLGLLRTYVAQTWKPTLLTLALLLLLALLGLWPVVETL